MPTMLLRPLANLDPETRDIAINLVLKRTREKSLILVMHGSEEYHQFFDRVVRIDAVAGQDDNYSENQLCLETVI